MSKIFNTLTIGDIHGKTSWKKCFECRQGVFFDLDGEKIDKIIFLGDFSDEGKYNPESRRIEQTVSTLDIFSNMLDIFKLKDTYPDTIVLLEGNHDYQYRLGKKTCSGYRSSYMRCGASDFLNNNYSSMGQAYQIGNVIWTHAGLCGSFKKNTVDPYIRSIEQEYGFEPSISEALNIMGARKGKELLLKNSTQWVRYADLVSDPISDYTQIVGHTRMKDIVVSVNEANNSVIYFCDVLDEKGKNFKLKIET